MSHGRRSCAVDRMAVLAIDIHPFDHYREELPCLTRISRLSDPLPNTRPLNSSLACGGIITSVYFGYPW